MAPARPLPASTRSESDVTVVIPAYNARATVEEAVRSARSMVRCEVIVVDDGSSDETANLAKSAGARVISQPNQGAMRARVNGMAEVNTDLVIFLDSDDRLEEGVNEALNLIRNESRVAVVGGALRVAKPNDSYGRTVRAPQDTFSTEDLIKRPYSPFPPSAAVWRADAVRSAENNLLPKIAQKYAEDFELLIRVSIVGTVATVPAVTCSYDAGGGKSAKNAVAAVESSEAIRKHYATQLGIPIKPLSPQAVVDQASWRIFRANQYEAGTKAAAISLLKRPTIALRIVRHHLRQQLRGIRR